MITPEVLLWKWVTVKENLERLGYDTEDLGKKFSYQNLVLLNGDDLAFVNDHPLKNLEALTYGRIPPAIDVTGFIEHVPPAYQEKGIIPSHVLLRFSQIIYALNTERFGAKPWADQLTTKNKERLGELQNALLTLVFYAEGTGNIGGFSIPEKESNNAFKTLSLFIDGYFGKGEYATFFNNLREFAGINKDDILQTALNPEKLLITKIKNKH